MFGLIVVNWMMPEYLQGTTMTWFSPKSTLRPSKLTWLAGNPPFPIGYTSSFMADFPLLAMLVDPGGFHIMAQPTTRNLCLQLSSYWLMLQKSGPRHRSIPKVRNGNFPKFVNIPPFVLFCFNATIPIGINRHILSWWGPGCPITETKRIGPFRFHEVPFSVSVSPDS